MADGSRAAGDSLTLYVHPFSSYCWKVLIPLWADGTPFTYRNVDQSDPSVMEELKRPGRSASSRCWSTTAQ